MVLPFVGHGMAHIAVSGQLVEDTLNPQHTVRFAKPRNVAEGRARHGDGNQLVRWKLSGWIAPRPIEGKARRGLRNDAVQSVAKFLDLPVDHEPLQGSTARLCRKIGPMKRRGRKHSDTRTAQVVHDAGWERTVADHWGNRIN